MKEMILLAVVLLIFVTAAGVSAQYYGSGGSYGFSYGIDYSIGYIETTIGPYFAFFLGGAGEFLFERILLFFIMIAVVFSILRKIPLFKDNFAVIWIITFAVSLLSMRFLGDFEVVKTILMPYSVLGIALTAAIPLVIYFFFVQGFDSSTLRKVLWIFFIVVFIGIWMSRYSELGTLSWIYFATGVVALFFLLWDGTIRRAMYMDKLKKLNLRNVEDHLRILRREMHDLHKDYSNHVIDDDYYYRRKKEIDYAIEDATKVLK